jgi:hypothetical protein
MTTTILVGAATLAFAADQLIKVLVVRANIVHVWNARGAIRAFGSTTSIALLTVVSAWGVLLTVTGHEARSL